MAVVTIGLDGEAAYRSPAYNQPYRQVVITNYDMFNPVYYSDSVGTIGFSSSQIPPGSAECFDGAKDIWLSTLKSNVTVKVDVKIGSRSFSPGAVAINGSVNATVSGDVNVTNTPSVNVASGTLDATVSGNVGITGTPNVSIANTPNVNVSSGSVNVAAGTVDVIGNGGTFPPGQTTTIVHDVTSNVVAPGFGHVIANLIDVGQYQSCNILVDAWANSQSSAGSAITATLSLFWFDDAVGANLVYLEDVAFYLANSASQQASLIGVTPVHGRYLYASVGNSGTVGNITITNSTMTASFRTPVYSSWRQGVPAMTINGVSVSSFNGNPTITNNLGSLANFVPGTGLKAYPLPLFSGPAYIRYQIGATTLSSAPTLIDASYVTSGTLAAGNGQPGQVWLGANTANTTDNQMIQLPRSPCLLVINPQAGSNLLFSAVGQQGY